MLIGGGDGALHAIDKATGREVWQAELPGRASANPMTTARAGHQFVVIATGIGKSASLVAFGLTDEKPATAPAPAPR